MPSLSVNIHTSASSSFETTPCLPASAADMMDKNAFYMLARCLVLLAGEHQAQGALAYWPHLPSYLRASSAQSPC
jgi:hypothetical protein